MTSSLKDIIKNCNSEKKDSINEIFVPPNHPAVPQNVVGRRKRTNTNPFLVSPTSSDSPTSSELAALFKKRRSQLSPDDDSDEEISETDKELIELRKKKNKNKSKINTKIENILSGRNSDKEKDKNSPEVGTLTITEEERTIDMINMLDVK